MRTSTLLLLASPIARGAQGFVIHGRPSNGLGILSSPSRIYNPHVQPHQQPHPHLHAKLTTRLFGKRGGNKSKSKEKGSNKGKKVSKANLPEKICVVCERPFTWRKKWERSWDEVTCCSKSCNSKRRSNGFVGTM
eukprot:137776_1